jgi:hypothetical protein
VSCSWGEGTQNKKNRKKGKEIEKREEKQEKEEGEVVFNHYFSCAQKQFVL